MARRKVVGIVLMGILILNLVGFSLGKIRPLLFWLVLAVVGLLAWKVVPKL